MSHFYGTLKGDRGAVTRRGTKASGISASAQSWDGSVTVDFSQYNETTLVTIRVGEKSEPGGRILWRGLLSALLANEAVFKLRCDVLPLGGGNAGGAK